MKQFFKFMFASMLGFLLTLVVGFFLFIGIISAIVAGSKSSEVPTLADNSILHIQFENAIQDRPSNNPLETFDFNSFEEKKPLSLSMIINNIKKAKNDDRIKGIYLDIPFIQANSAAVEEIRKALIDFKSSDKFIVSYAENYGQREYYLSSVADEIYINPVGDMTFKGLSAQVMFFKDMLSRLDVDVQVIRHGKFKSAVEPFMLDKMSDANRAQYSTIVNSLWDNQTANIAKARGISVEELNNIADKLLVRGAKDAKELKLVDDLKFEDEVLAILKSKVGLDEGKKLKTIALSKLNKIKKSKSSTEDGSREKFNSKNKIAVIFAEGEIVSGKSSDGSMGSETIVKAIKKARKDDKVKAIVLRVNSPGGSALASDVMWREVTLAKAAKPVVVSMGGVAASGGYYISCAADKIYAENSTITGSIGVFGIIPNMKGLFNNKLGINIDQVNTNKYSDGLSTTRPMDDYERATVQEMVEDIYDDFTMKVANGRGMTQAAVDSIGQGRVWTGANAKDIGLVDEIGGLNDAINAAADMAELEDYKLRELPIQEDPIQKMIEGLSAQARISILGDEIGKAEHYYSNIKSVLNSKGMYTRLPVNIIIE